MNNNWLREILSATSGQLSSKRVCGVLGFLISTYVLLYCTYRGVQAPNMIEAFMICCMGLLGVDSVTSIWKKLNDLRLNNCEDNQELD